MDFQQKITTTDVTVKIRVVLCNITYCLIVKMLEIHC